MKFRSIQDLLERVDINATAAECLGLSGALGGTLDDGLNEKEAALWAKEYVSYLRDLQKYEEKLQRHHERALVAECKFREALDEREKKTRKDHEKYNERLSVWQQEADRRQRLNEKNRAAGKRELIIPKPPPLPKPRAEVKVPVALTLPAPPEPPSKPRITLSQRERVRLQKEMLHIYLSGHPLDEASPDSSLTDISKLASLRPGTTCAIRGVLLSHKVTNTRRKQLMARLRLEDKTGSIEVVAFPSLYSRLQGVIQDGEIYKVTGEVDVVGSGDNEDPERVHTQFKGQRVEVVRIGSDKDWDISYPLLIGSLRILPSSRQTSRGKAASIIIQHARE